MPRVVVPLTDLKCERARPKPRPYKLGDGQGLHLLVKPNGSKSWRMKYFRPDGRENTLVFGNYPAVSLKLARQKRDEAHSQLAQGIDPAEQARIERELDKATFEVVAREWHAYQVQIGKWKPITANKVMQQLADNIFPSIGHIPIESLKTRDLLLPLRAVEKRGARDVAARLQQKITAIMRRAVQSELIESNPALDLAGAVTAAKVKHRAALPLEQLPDLLERIDKATCRPLTRLAMLLTLHVFARSSELRFARWDEVNFERQEWVIPAKRESLPDVKHSDRGSKMGDEHLIPLSPQAIALLRQIKSLAGTSALIFPSDRSPLRPMSENTVNKALRDLGYDTKSDVCGHGFRTMACSALVESGLWATDAIERQMSHKERNGVRAAYIHRAEHLQERRLMLAWWSDYLDACRTEYLPPYEAAHRLKSKA